MKERCWPKYKVLFIFTILLMLSTVLPYIQTARFDFVNLDDWKYVRECAWINQGYNVDSVLKCFTEFRDTGCWFPVTRLSYLFDVTLFGMRPSVMHIHNVVLHSVNAVLVFLFLLIVVRKVQQRKESTVRLGYQSEKMGGFCLEGSSILSMMVVFLATLFWSLHPLRVESVAWIASRKDLLSLLWEMAALIIWVRSTDGALRGWKHWPVVFFVIAMMAKPTAITFAPLIIVLDVLLLGKVRWDRIKTVFIITIPLFGLSVYTQQVVRGSVENPLMHVPFVGRLANAINSVGLYLWQTLWPEHLYAPCLYQWPKIPYFFVQGLACCILIGCLFAWYAYKNRFWFSSCPDRRTPPQFTRSWDFAVLGLLGYIISVSPMLGIISFGYQAHADRFTYLPSVWLSLLVVLLLDSCKRTWGSRAWKGIIGMGLCICGMLLILTYRQAGYWQDTETLSRRALLFDPENVVANRNLGVHLFLKKQKPEESGFYIERAMLSQRDPLMFITGITMLVANEDMTRATAMTKEFIAAIKREEKNGWDIHYRIAYAFETYCQGELKLAEEHFLVVAGQNPVFAPVQYMLGKLALKAGNTDSAEKHWSVARKDVMFRDWL
jgi:hypothetical protein